MLYTIQTVIICNVLTIVLNSIGQNVAYAAVIPTNKTNATDSNRTPGLLVISYDAFRPEYFNRSVTPFMNALVKEATRAKYMRNVFPTKTFVNHFTMATVSVC